MSDLHYQGSKWQVGNSTYVCYLCMGARSRGKTTYWINNVTQRALKYEREEGPNHRHKYIYLRRQEKQLQLAIREGLYNFRANVYGELYVGMTERCHNGEIKLIESVDGKNTVEHIVGRYYDLNTVKGISVEDCDVLIFDEYIELKRVDYKKGADNCTEPDLLARLLETLFRQRTFWLIMLANSDTFTNPYHEYFHIPFNVDKYRNKTNGIWYEHDVAPNSVREKRAQTSIGKLFKGTNYDRYALGDTAATAINTEFIAEKPNHAKQVCNIRIMAQNLTVWIDDNTTIMYISNKYKFNNYYPIYSVTRADMTINTEFVEYNVPFITNMRIYYSQGRVRFSDESVAELFYLMIKLI